MKKIDKDELFQNVSTFLKSKGVTLDEGSYTQRIHQGCDLLADTINETQEVVARARVEVDKTLDQIRHMIHEATAPKESGSPPAPEPENSGTKVPPVNPARSDPLF